MLGAPQRLTEWVRQRSRGTSFCGGATQNGRKIEISTQTRVECACAICLRPPAWRQRRSITSLVNASRQAPRRLSASSHLFDVLDPAIHGELAHLGDVMIHHRIGPEFLGLVAVPVHHLLERAAVARGQILLRHADRDGADRRACSRDSRAASRRSRLVVSSPPPESHAEVSPTAVTASWMFCTAAPIEASRMRSLFSSYSRCPFRRGRDREGRLPALVGQHDDDRDRVGHVGLLDRGKALDVIDQPVGLREENIEHPLAHRPGRRRSPCRSIASWRRSAPSARPRRSAAASRAARCARLEAAHAAAPADDVDQGG